MGLPEAGGMCRASLISRSDSATRSKDTAWVAEVRAGTHRPLLRVAAAAPITAVARRKISSSIASVSRPVNVFC